MIDVDHNDNDMNNIDDINIKHNSIKTKIKTVPLFDRKNNIIKEVDIDNAIYEIYYQYYRVPTETELKTADIDIAVDTIKQIISASDTYIPLYDVYTSNIYIIQKRNVYIRVVNHDYRFPDESIFYYIVSLRQKILKKLENKPELKNDKVFMRSLRKMNLIGNFLSQLDLNIMYKTYLTVFYRYSPEIGNITYTCVRRSFIPHKGHLKPYYTQDEVIKLGLNNNLFTLTPDSDTDTVNDTYIKAKDRITDNIFKKLCASIRSNDISAEILIQHQNYIVDKNLVGLVQYYTLQGSYFMNQYLRGFVKYEYRNEYLEENIAKVWNLVLNAPPFDNDYVLYRFVNTDEYLKGLKIGDVYVDNGFMSTTHDPFYRNDLYKFGFILIKIRIPGKIKGVGLCLELLSHFPAEEEIILPPLTKLRLIAKNEDTIYYHPNDQYAASVKTRYEFDWIGNTNVTFADRPKLPSTNQTQLIDFLDIKKVRTMSLKEKIDYIMKQHFDPMNRILCKIGDLTFYVVGEWYDSTSAYYDMYAIKTSDGFSLYSIYEGYILFMIEIGDVDGNSQLRVNYYTKYSRINRQKIMGDDNFIKFISSIAYYFDIPNVVIYADFMSCDIFMNKQINNEQINNKQINNEQINNEQINNKQINNKQINDKQINQERQLIQIGGVEKQRTYMVSLSPKKIKNAKTKVPLFPYSINKNRKIYEQTPNVDDIATDIDENIEIDNDTFTGGSYCSDFYRYFKYNEKRYHNDIVEMQPLFSYHDLDELKHNKPSTILRREDRDEIYQIYVKNYVLTNPIEKDNLADFYIWIIENKCYLIDIFIKKMDRLYQKVNPFKKNIYVLDAMAYLYNHKYVQTYNRFIKMNIDEEHQLLDIPKNEYRIRR